MVEHLGRNLLGSQLEIVVGVGSKKRGNNSHHRALGNIHSGRRIERKPSSRQFWKVLLKEDFPLAPRGDMKEKQKWPPRRHGSRGTDPGRNGQESDQVNLFELMLQSNNQVSRSQRGAKLDFLYFSTKFLFRLFECVISYFHYVDGSMAQVVWRNALFSKNSCSAGRCRAVLTSVGFGNLKCSRLVSSNPSHLISILIDFNTQY